MAQDTTQKGVRPEDLRTGLISEKELIAVSDVYTNFYKWKTYRAGLIKHFQNYSFEEMLISSRMLFWNSMTSNSQDLKNLGLEFSIPFARKETMDFLGRITALNIKPHICGDDLDAIGVKVLNGLYRKWRFKSNDKVEKFWEMLYGLVNGTVCSYIGYNNTKLQRRYLRSYDYETGQFSIEKKDQTYWNDVWKEIVPIEDIYLPKIYERNIQKQGRLIWKTQMDEADFHAEFNMKYKNAKYVVAGNRIAEDSLYYRLLGGSGTTSYNKVEILRQYDWLKDEFVMTASGILLNHLGGESDPTIAPMPFDHKMGPFTWGITSPLDEKIAYGLPTPFLVKDPHKILNVGYCVTPETKILTRDLRWVEAQSLKVGDKIMGFDEFGKPCKATGESTIRRHYQDAEVTNTGRKIAPVYKITLEDGTILNSTENHRWITWKGIGNGSDWMRTDVMSKTISEGIEVYMPKYFDVYEQDISYESGYLAGIFDGEGSLNLGKASNNINNRTRGIQLSFVQQNNEAMKKATGFLKNKGFDYFISKRKLRKGQKETCDSIILRGGFREVMRFFMQTRPERIIKEAWMRKNLSDMLLQKKYLIKVLSAEYIGEKEIITLESSSKTYFAEGFGAHNTMMIEREFRAIDPVILSSDIESPELIYGQHRVINVNNVEAYKEFKLSETSNQYFTMLNSLQSNMSAQAQGGDSTVIPSRQPQSAKGVDSDDQQKQQAMANSVVMYYDIIRQEILLSLKTMFQFYTSDKYDKADKRVYRQILIPNMPLTLGGTGNLKVRIVAKKKDEMDLFLEAIRESAAHGKQTEIIEVPLEFIQNLEFEIEKIDLEPDNPSDLELANFVENVIQPMLNVYVPAGVADISKVYLRHLEKMGESPADFSSDQVASQLASGKPMQPPQQQQAQVSGQGGPQLPNPQTNVSSQVGNMRQSLTGMKFGGQNNKGLPIKK